MRTAIYRPRAAYDIESIVLYLGQVAQSPDKARTWYDSLQSSVKLLCEFPDLGRTFEDERLTIQGRRTYLVGAYRLFYSYSESELIVWRVVHTSQDIDDYAIVDLCD
ncbi:type II toxin-antitoxin system RelE/ParE family toxin [Raoultibacter massiliensis]|uniref:Type II toxin-antitoxin system RelE/ParE family toxin n=1 Tax=Raoultibacter massiliensis TaxID=1852371 RepID=A0ABV1JBQ5_9ACTN|nr:type II toxin-antitoxin system RelE/ParE family toxin [Raoultibacter massiliensis]